MFDATEQSLNEFALKVAAPIVAGVVVGGGAIGTTLLIGVVSASLLAGGFVVLTSVAITGKVLSPC